ncbi:MAG: serine hydrolase [Actinomycetota bacterium]
MSSAIGQLPPVAPARNRDVARPAASSADDARDARRKPPRDGFLDTVRSIAIVRVMIWHAFGAPWISWVVATMPTMFFVAGSLLASTLDRKPVSEMYRARLKRLLLPFWFFGACVLLLLALVHLSNPTTATALSLDQLLPWIFPLADPTGSAWEGGWASSPLWYLRAYLWLLLLSPILRAGVRRAGTLALLPSILATVAIEWWLHNPDALPLTPGTWTWLLGDFTLYSFFLMLGFVHHDGAFERLKADGLCEWILIGAVACVVWWWAFPAPTGVVNHSFVALMAVGVAWLGFFLLLRPVLSRATANTLSGPLVHWLTRRAMSVYMWHSPCIVAGYRVMDAVAPDASRGLVLIPMAGFLVVAVVLTGWVEDVAGGRPPELWPSATRPLLWQRPWSTPRGRPGAGSQLVRRHGIGVTAGVTVALILAAVAAVPSAATAGPAGTDTLPPAPSGRPAIADFGAVDGGDRLPEAESEGTTLPPAPSGRPAVTEFWEVSGDDGSAAGAAGVTPQTLEGVIAAWLADKDVTGARVAVSAPDGSLTTAAVGEDRGESLSAQDVVPLTSATKSVTAAIVLGLVDQGLLELDAPIPQLSAVPEFAHAVTLRQLLDHTAGVAPYQETAGFDPNEAMTPDLGVRLAAAEPLQWAAGSQRGYSNNGYLVLGLLAEQATGRPFADLVAERLAEVGLPTMELAESLHNGWIGWSAGGLVGDVADLARWGAALYRDRTVLSDAALDHMTTIDDTFGVALGAFPACPCGVDESGERTYTSIGHSGGEVSFHWSPADDVVIAVSLTESMWTPFLDEADVHELMATIRTIL